MRLGELEKLCRERITNTPADFRGRAGSLLRSVPEQSDWELFQQQIRGEWKFLEEYPQHFPSIFLTLYAALAFHEYEDNTFWPAFCRVVGVAQLSPNRQTVINEVFADAARQAGLQILKHGGHRWFVASAVFFIGVPISLWDGFLSICDWALWHSGWESLSDLAWNEAMTKRCGGRKRLLNFLTDNRPTATGFINEMLAARKLLVENPTASLADVSPNIDRREYFEQVPETAEFLRPDNPDSLLDDSPRLFWRQGRIAVHLPSVPIEGASWRFADEQQLASNSATEFPINGKAFQDRLTVELHTPSSKIFSIAGLEPFGLFDEQRGRFANADRSRLPANSYQLISKVPLDGIVAQGWAEFEGNERIQLEDGTDVFVTSLWPAKNRPTLSINGGHKIEFGRRQRVNVRVFSGCDDSYVFRFALRDDGRFLVERMPVLVLEIPVGFLPDEHDLLNREFRVVVNGRYVSGKWQFYEDYPSNEPEWEYSLWKWGEAFPLGDYEIQVESSRVGVLPFGVGRRSQHVTIVPATADAIWPSLHGEKFWIWVLLSQIQDEATWEEFWIARQAVAGFRDLRVNQNDWRKLEEHGFISVRRKIEIRRSCLAMQATREGTFVGHYAGLVNRLYALASAVAPVRRIEAKQEHGLPPHLEIHWPANQRQLIRSICSREGIEVRDNSLWNR